MVGSDFRGRPLPHLGCVSGLLLFEGVVFHGRPLPCLPELPAESTSTLEGSTLNVMDADLGSSTLLEGSRIGTLLSHLFFQGVESNLLVEWGE